jgi:hypothetical protein
MLVPMEEWNSLPQPGEWAVAAVVVVVVTMLVGVIRVLVVSVWFGGWVLVILAVSSMVLMGLGCARSVVVRIAMLVPLLPHLHPSSVAASLGCLPEWASTRV